MWPMIVWFCSVCGIVRSKAPVVTIKGHQIKGLQADGYAKFLGIPYAVVDKNNRFGPSKPHPGLGDDFEAYESKVCPQIENEIVIGTLDCLTLEVYVPNVANSHNRLPVMVWIPEMGGGFATGTASAFSTPNSLLKNDVIVVAISYRLDIYGFMCLDIPEVPGNQGLKDQVLALKWIKENIEAFGGNAKQITVFGESFGGISIGLHLFSSYEKLFQRAIIQSGSALTPWWATKSNSKQSILKLARKLAFNTSDLREALKYVSTIDAHKLLQKVKNFKNIENINEALKYLSSINAHKLLKTVKNFKNIEIKPCIEKKFKGIENFITEHPSNIVSSKARTTPVIIGHNNNEAAVFVDLIQNEHIQYYSFGDVLKSESLNNDSEAEDTVRHFYIGDEKITANVKRNLSNFVSDFFYGWPIQRMVDQLLQNYAGIVYRYIFSYSGGRNLQKMRLNINSTGATHGDELGYLFDYEILSEKTTPEDQLMIDRMSTIWTNFAKFGNPVPRKTKLLPIKWNTITKTNHPYLDINLELTLGAAPMNKRMAFWDLFYKVYVNTRYDMPHTERRRKAYHKVVHRPVDGRGS